MSQYAILTEDLTQEFATVRAVDSLRLQIPAGVIFGFLGPNGAGKTTTIRLLLGLLQPTRGRATVLGFDTTTQGGEIRQRSGALLEHAGLYERLSAADNLEFYGRVWQLPAAERQARIKSLLTHLDLWDRRQESVTTWSRGMKQKLALARALLHRPALLFLDEPTAGLDPVAVAALRDDLATLSAQESVTVFLTTHNLAEAEKVCDLVGVIRAGRLLAMDSPERLRPKEGPAQVVISGKGFDENVVNLLRRRPEVRTAEASNGHLAITLQNSEVVGPLVTLLVESGATVEEVQKRKSSLEDVFLAMMEEERP